MEEIRKIMSEIWEDKSISDRVKIMISIGLALAIANTLLEPPKQ